ncbi:hypothetical protein FRB95_010921 [Tulasnella sp. JGI-2019a]|nr:hypothetical protein FRB95_010921 [Tulasnella sp. JGI-2019a]
MTSLQLAALGHAQTVAHLIFVSGCTSTEWQAFINPTAEVPVSVAVAVDINKLAEYLKTLSADRGAPVYKDAKKPAALIMPDSGGAYTR